MAMSRTRKTVLIITGILVSLVLVVLIGLAVLVAALRHREPPIANNSVLTLPQLSTCPQCAAPFIPHRVCPACGFYKGRQVINVEAIA